MVLQHYNIVSYQYKMILQQYIFTGNNFYDYTLLQNYFAAVHYGFALLQYCGVLLHFYFVSLQNFFADVQNSKYGFAKINAGNVTLKSNLVVYTMQTKNVTFDSTVLRVNVALAKS